MKESVIVGIVALVVILAGFVIFFNMTGITANVASTEFRDYKCVDSDGELSVDESVFVKGSVTRTKISDSRVLDVKEDTCKNSVLVEYYCKYDSRALSKKIRCESGECVDGACVK
tara:strand:+ start:3431 stop:3775 length:345 start_codon:yes stop_codon:yes gene_type:complete